MLRTWDECLPIVHKNIVQKDEERGNWLRMMMEMEGSTLELEIGDCDMVKVQHDYL